MAYEAKILKDSISPVGARLTTMEVTFPRIVLAELNTHRMFSRNSASSRAIPVEKMLKKVKEDPFIPVHWGKNQKGMQAEQEFSDYESEGLKNQWLKARDSAVFYAESLQLTGVHKQITNRLLEPFLYHTVIVTATEWDNFWGLRCNKDAQPEIQKIARMMQEEYKNSTPLYVGHGEWHLPLVDDLHVLKTSGYSASDIAKICVGRCTRVSYLTHDGKRDPQADIDLYDRLLSAGHMSPLEHAARPMNSIDKFNDHKTSFCGNLRGWVQLRKEIANEDNFSLALKVSNY